jgi:arylsulfatase A-like enzyme
MRAAVLVLLLALLDAARAERPHVYLVIVDGLAPGMVTATRMPVLLALVEREKPRSTLFREARAVMPARTNPNHVSLLTGVHPAAHGITGNAHWSRVAGAPPARLDDPALIEVETLFTVIEETSPRLVTAGVFGKPKLARLFSAVPGRQRGPDHLWSPARDAPAGGRDRVTGYSFDATTLEAVLHLERTSAPDLAVVNLADVDRVGHGRGPESPEYAQAVTAADAAIGRLVDHLRAAGRWQRSVVIVTADHGFADLTPGPARPDPVIRVGRVLERAGVGGVQLVADGGVEHVYAEGLPAEAPDAGAARDTLARVARLAAGTPGVAEVLARLPVPGARSLVETHPDWQLGHPRTGELLLVAAPGFQFVDPFDRVAAGLRGNHGGPEDARVPLVVTGGWSGLRTAPPDTPSPSLVDVAPTIAALLAVRGSRRADGGPVERVAMGRPLGAVLRDQSPH